MSRRITVTAGGDEYEFAYCDRQRGFRLDIGFIPDDEEMQAESETGAYTHQTWLSPYLPDEMDYPSQRSDLTKDVLEAALRGWIEDYEEEHGHGIKEIERFDVNHVAHVRRLV